MAMKMYTNMFENRFKTVVQPVSILNQNQSSCYMSLQPSMWNSGWSQCKGPLPPTGLLPCILLPLQTRSPTQLLVQPLGLAQSRSHTEEGEKNKTRGLNQLREGREGKRRGEKTPCKSKWSRNRKTETYFWQTANLWQCEKCSLYARVKERRHVFKDAQAGVRLLWRSDCAQVKINFFAFFSVLQYS